MELLEVFLQKDKKQPLYEQLYDYLVEEIHTKRILPGEKLPGKRAAAAQLGVSVNTVDQAYQMLAAEGYVLAKERSGFIVNRLERRLVPPPRTSRPVLPSPAPKNGAGEKPAYRYSFATGDIDTSLFPVKTWNRLFRDVLTGEPSLFARGAAMGDENLRNAIAGYLRAYRGVHCTADMVAVGAGLEVLTGMLLRLFAGVPVAVETPGYPKNRHILRNMGNPVCPVAVDEGGMQPALLRESGAKIAYITPSHQFPTGAVMPVGRRMELLQWAAETGGVVIEDDYDSEFRFDGRPLPSLQGLDEGGHVVYAGTFSRSLAPGIRAAYLVLPPSILRQWQQAYGDYTCTVSRPEQHTLARFMDGGHFARSLNRMRAAYKKRRGELINALAKYLPPAAYEMQNIHTGLYFILRLPGRDAAGIAQKAVAKGVRLHTLAEYSANGAPHNRGDSLVLGYGGLTDTAIEDAVKILASCL